MAWSLAGPALQASPSPEPTPGAVPALTAAAQTRDILEPVEVPLTLRFSRMSLLADAGGTASALTARPPLVSLPGVGSSGLLPAEADRPLPLLGRYRQALDRESRRVLDKEPALGWMDQLDAEGYPEARARRQAERIFNGATSRVMSDVLERLIEEAAALRSARDYIDGIRLDVKKGGGMDVGGARGESDEDRGVAARFNLIASGRPRLEMRTRLPGDIRTRVEIPLTDPGIRATFNRKLTSSLDGKLSAGVEDSGRDTWISASLELRF